MAEYIPVAPPSQPEPVEVPPEPSPPDGSQRRKVLDQSQISGLSFDEDILSDIESRLEADSGEKAPRPAADKVELDKADLPVLDAIIPPPASEEPPAEVEVDLAGEDQAAPAPEDAAEAVPSRKRLLLIVAGVASLALGLGLTLWFTLLVPSKQVVVGPPPQTLTGDKIPDPAKALRLEMEPFLVPLTQGDKGRLLKVALSLEVSDPADKDLLLPHKVNLRDAIYRLLRDRPAEEVQGARTKNLLQAQIKSELNHVLGSVIIYQVYFTEFVITG